MRAAVMALAATLVVATAGLQAQSHLVIVSGLGGDAEHRERFYELGRTLVDAATERLGLASERVLYLAERPARDPVRITDRSTKENVERVLRDLAGSIGPMAELTIVLIGHGSYQGDESRFNLPGPDLTANDFATLLDLFPTQRVAFVNTASASGEFVKALSGERRTIVTATKSGFERNEAVFGQYFVEAFASDVADADKDERVSIHEAFAYAKREVARFYDREGRLLTEHALLDDNGDGEGSTDADAAAPDGAIARTFFLAAVRGGPATVTTDDPELARLYGEKARLEQQIAELRLSKDDMEEARYEARLEALLLDLARTSQAIRAREGTGGL